MKSLLVATLLLAGLGVPDPADTPVLLSAAINKSKMVLIISHPTASHYSARIRWQDEGMTGQATSFIANLNAKQGKPVKTLWTAPIKIPGDTNWVSVAVFGTTNWSNEINVIP